MWPISPCFEGWLLASSLLIQSGLDTCTKQKVFTRLIHDETFEVKVQLYIYNQRFNADFSQPWKGAIPGTECSVFLS